MNRPPARERETQELIQRFQAKRAHGRQLRLVAAVLGGAIVVAAVVVAVLLAAHTSGSQADNGPGGGTSPGGGTGPATSSTQAPRRLTSADRLGASDRRAPPRPSARRHHHLGAATDRVTTTAHATTTTAGHTTTTAPHPASTTGGQTAGKVVVIDPGHQAQGRLRPGAGRPRLERQEGQGEQRHRRHVSRAPRRASWSWPSG